MKKILLLCATILLIGSFVDLQAQAVDDWRWSHPKPVGQNLRWCHMFDANTYYAVGFGGNFLKTTDAGTTWNHTVLSLPWRGDNTSAYDAHFFNMNTGVVCAYRDIYRTTDGGTTWDTCAGTQAQTSSWYKMSFINSNTGFVAGASGRVYKTTDAGLTWASIMGNIGTSTKYSVYAINENIIMAGESSADIWRTTNGGTNWTEINKSGGNVYHIEFINSTTGFFSGTSTTLYKSTDAGATWNTFNSGLPSSSFYDIDFGPPGPSTGMAEEKFTGTTFPPTGWKSVNVLGSRQWERSTLYSYSSPASARIQYQSGTGGGEDWLITKQIPVGGADSLVFWLRKYYTAAYPPDSMIVRLSTSDTAMASFTNILGRIDVAHLAGNTWHRFAYPLSAYAGNAYIAFQHKDNDGNGCFLDDVSVGLNSPPPAPTVYVTGNPNYIYKSSITSPSWDTLGYRVPNQIGNYTFYSTSLASNGDSLLTVGRYGLIYKRNNASNRISFRPDWTWMTSTINYSIGVIGNRVMLPTSYSAIWYTTTGGTDWDTMKTNTTYSGTLYSISTFGNNAWVCGYSGKVNKSTDGGVTWSEIYDQGSASLRNVNFVDANTGWVFGNLGTIRKTTNGGTTWATQTAAGVTSTIYGSSFVDANTGWLVGSSGKVSKTTDGGSTWTAQTSKFSNTLRNIDMVNANTGWMVGYTGCIRGTTNGGTDWDTVHTPFYPYVTNYAVDFVDQWNGMVTGANGLTLRTRDGGQTWVYENTGGYSLNCVKMTSTDSGWAGSSSGYKFKYVETINNGNTYTHIVPGTYELAQNYPNPFNPMTTIQFALPKAGMVSLKIYDVSGRLVRTLVNNEGLNEGTFKYIFDGSSIASGVYFYSLLVDDNLIGTKKMILIK